MTVAELLCRIGLHRYEWLLIEMPAPWQNYAMRACKGCRIEHPYRQERITP